VALDGLGDTLNLRRNTTCVFLLSVAFLLQACSAEVSRGSFEDLAPGQLTAQLYSSKEVQFWVELDVVYSGEQELGYDLTVTQADQVVADVQCDALDVRTKVMSREIRHNERWSRRYQGRMRCPVTVPQDGLVVVDVVPFARPVPRGL
jgi:hypothetical protein